MVRLQALAHLQNDAAVQNAIVVPKPFHDAPLALPHLPIRPRLPRVFPASDQVAPRHLHPTRAFAAYAVGPRTWHLVLAAACAVGGLAGFLRPPLDQPPGFGRSSYVHAGKKSR